MPPAVRIGDPTADGVVTGPGVPTVLIAGMPAACLGDISTPASGNIPGPFIAASTTVLIGGKPALRVGDAAANGSPAIIGAFTVNIG